eukprot:COSAG01_NODE_17_length_39991_cov_30.596160_7_plen_97_part_00
MRACRGAASPHPAGYLGQVDVLTSGHALSVIHPNTRGGIIEGPFELSPPDPFRLYPPGPFRLQPQVLFASTPRSVSRSNFFSSQRAPNAHKNLRKK